MKEPLVLSYSRYEGKGKKKKTFKQKSSKQTTAKKILGWLC